ncbi:MAG: hypothetical protein H7Y88_05965, partial [Phycisphaerales bacterium]|nr:hypothetical protein [Phycisphaerales bacterium]
ATTDPTSLNPPSPIAGGTPAGFPPAPQTIDTRDHTRVIAQPFTPPTTSTRELAEFHWLDMALNVARCTDAERTRYARRLAELKARYPAAALDASGPLPGAHLPYPYREAG